MYFKAVCNIVVELPTNLIQFIFFFFSLFLHVSCYVDIKQMSCRNKMLFKIIILTIYSEWCDLINFSLMILKLFYWIFHSTHDRASCSLFTAPLIDLICGQGPELPTAIIEDNMKINPLSLLPFNIHLYTILCKANAACQPTGLFLKKKLTHTHSHIHTSKVQYKKYFAAYCRHTFAVIIKCKI